MAKIGNSPIVVVVVVVVVVVAAFGFTLEFHRSLKDQLPSLA